MAHLSNGGYWNGGMNGRSGMVDGRVANKKRILAGNLGRNGAREGFVSPLIPGSCTPYRVEGSSFPDKNAREEMIYLDDFRTCCCRLLDAAFTKT